MEILPAIPRTSRTRLNPAINLADDRLRLVVFARGRTFDGRESYAFDWSIEGDDPRFRNLIAMLFGESIPRVPGFVRLPIDSGIFSVDENLDDLLERFDEVSGRGWIRTMRTGDTGIGYTFETLMGIRENNDRRADFRGIEVKCKLAKEFGASSGKINLFQQGPVWSDGRSAIERLKAIGRRREDGVHACYSQVTVETNNLELILRTVGAASRIEIAKCQEAIGHWTYALLQRRLEEKHSRAVFVKASARGASQHLEYRDGELVYCERPSIERFVEMVGSRSIVFEFLMHETAGGGVRNHGYPWRLANQTHLSPEFFAVQIRLRG